MAQRKPLARRAPRTPSSVATTSAKKALIRKQKARRQVRHASLLSRLHTTSSARTSASGGVSKPLTKNVLPKAKTRRPSKKLAGAATLSADLLASLPDDQASEQKLSQKRQAPSSDVTNRKGAGLADLMGKSLENKRGVQRRRDIVSRLERERWAKNWGIMVARRGDDGSAIVDQGGEVKEGGNAEQERRQGERWQALRRQISGSLANG